MQKLRATPRRYGKTWRRETRGARMTVLLPLTYRDSHAPCGPLSLHSLARHPEVSTGTRIGKTGIS